MGNLSSLTFLLGANIKDFQTKMRIAKNDMQSVGKSMQKIGGMMTLAVTAPLTGIGVATIKAASDAEEIGSKFSVVYRDILAEAEMMADGLDDAYGLSSVKSKQLLADTGDLLTGFGFTQQGALQLAGEVNKLAVDLASFTNFHGGAEGASVALTKALLGESEQAKALGIVIRQDSEEYKNLVNHYQKTEGATHLQAKALAALEIATNQSKNAIGDYARTSDSFANQQRELTEDLKDVAVMFGEILMPLAKQLQEVLRGVVEWFKNLSDGGKKIITIVAGIAAGFGPLLLTIGFLSTNVIPGLISAFGAIKVAFTSLATAISANPIGALVTILGVAAGALLLFKRRTEDAEEAQWRLGDAIANVSTELGKQIYEAYMKVGDIAEDGTATITKSLDGLGDAMKKMTKEELQSLKNYLEGEYSNASRIAANATDDFTKTLYQEDIDDYTSALGLVNAELEKYKKYTDQATGSTKKFRSTYQLDKLEPVSGPGKIETEPYNLDTRPIEDMSIAFSELVYNMELLEQASQSMTQTVESAISNLASGVADSIGRLMAGISDASDIPVMMVGILGGMLQQLGKIAIKTGVGLLAIKTAFKTMNPYVAIAAGAALVALGAVIKSSIKSMGAKGMQLGGIVPPGYPNDTYPALLTSGETVTPPNQLPPQRNNGHLEVSGNWRLSGDDLLMSFERAEKRKRRSAG